MGGRGSGRLHEIRWSLSMQRVPPQPRIAAQLSAGRRADENVDLGGTSVGEVKSDDSVLLTDSNKPMAQVQAIGSMRTSQHALEVGTVNVTKGCTEATSVGPALGNRERRHPTVISPTPPNKLGRLCRKSRDRIKTTETLEFAASICSQ